MDPADLAASCGKTRPENLDLVPTHLRERTSICKDARACVEYLLPYDLPGILLDLRSDEETDRPEGKGE